MNYIIMSRRGQGECWLTACYLLYTCIENGLSSWHYILKLQLFSVFKAGFLFLNLKLKQICLLSLLNREPLQLLIQATGVNEKTLIIQYNVLSCCDIFL